MAEAVVHCLEAIEVDDHDGDVTTVSFGSSNGVLEAVIEERSVRQAGERVVQRLMT